MIYFLNDLDGLIKGTQIKLSSSRTRKIEEKDEGIKKIKKNLFFLWLFLLNYQSKTIILEKVNYYLMKIL